MPSVEIGVLAPPYSFHGADGHRRTLADYSGETFILLFSPIETGRTPSSQRLTFEGEWLTVITPSRDVAEQYGVSDRLAAFVIAHDGRVVWRHIAEADYASRAPGSGLSRGEFVATLLAASLVATLGSAAESAPVVDRRSASAASSWDWACRLRRIRPSVSRRRRSRASTIVVQAATHEFGTGTYTAMSQVAATALGVPVDRIRFELGDTNYPENPISAGSMTASSTGPAVDAAARALRQRIESLGGQAAAVERCRALVGANGGRDIEARASAKPGDEQRQYSMHSFGAVFAEVRIDPDLGEIRVPRIVGAYGVGRVLNEKTARSQLAGGIVYGISMALFERTAIDPHTGRYLNADLSEYLVPVNRDVAEIDVLFVDEDDDYVDPIGVKGIGEIGTTGVAGAIANAVYHATGVRVRDLPITLDKALRLA